MIVKYLPKRLCNILQTIIKHGLSKFEILHEANAKDRYL